MRGNKKFLIPIIIVLLVITILVVVLLVLMKKKPNNPNVSNETLVTNEVANVVEPTTSTKPVEPDLSNVDKKYSDVAKAFAKALAGEKAMESFVDKYVDATAIIALSKTDGDYDKFYELYSEVGNDEIEDLKQAFMEMVSKNYSFEITKMTKIKELGDANEAFVSSNVTITDSDGKEATFLMIFFHGDDLEILVGLYDMDNKLVTENASDFLNYFLVASSVETKMSSQEIELYNSDIVGHAGDQVTGKDVKTLINNIITKDKQYIGESGKFIGIYADIEDFESSEDLKKASDAANTYLDGENDEDNVNAATELFSSLKDSIMATKYYNVEINYEKLSSGKIVSSVAISNAE